MLNCSITVYVDEFSHSHFTNMFAAISKVDVVANPFISAHAINNRPTQTITFLAITKEQWFDVKRHMFAQEMYNTNNIQNFGYEEHILEE